MFSAAVIHQDGSVVVLLAGELDIATAGILRQSIDELVNPHLGAVTLDLRDLTFVDGAGLRAILDTQQTVTAVGANSGCDPSVS